MIKNNIRNLNKALAEANIPELMAIVDTLDSDGKKLLLVGIGTQLTEAKKKALVKAIRSQVTVADVAVRDWLVKSIATSYVSGLNTTDLFLKKFDIKVAKEKITIEILKTAGDLKPHLQVVNSLISDAYLDFGTTMNGYVKGAEKILNDTLRKQVRQDIALGRLDGASVREIKKVVTQTLGDRGFTVLLDRGGNQWELSRYSEMLTRTHLIRANNEATINRAGDFEIDIVEVSTHGATDEICAGYEGKIFSISGKSREYPKLEEEPPFHPNCKHSLLLRPDLE